MPIQKDLIVDIGLHKGLDSNFYSKKGFRVVGIEASPALCQEAISLNSDFIEQGKIVVVQKALYYKSGINIDFFANEEKDDWGSLSQADAEKGVTSSKKITVDTITLQDIVDQFGVPYYIKCDIEGGDAIFARQLTQLATVPTFVSIEATNLDDLAMLRAAGYDRFQIVNQWLNPQLVPPNPAREGNYTDFSFTHHTSGLFGKELPEGNWRNLTATAQTFLKWYDILREYPSISVGWLDIHACKAGDDTGIN